MYWAVLVPNSSFIVFCECVVKGVTSCPHNEFCTFIWFIYYYYYYLLIYLSLLLLLIDLFIIIILNYTLNALGLWLMRIYNFSMFFVSARTNKGHHHHLRQKKVFATARTPTSMMERAVLFDVDFIEWDPSHSLDQVVLVPWYHMGLTSWRKWGSTKLL